MKRKICALVCLGAMLFAGWKLWSIYAEYAEGEKLYDDLAGQYTTMTWEAEEQEARSEVPISVSFEELLDECPDVVGWLYCAGTPINYPVVQGGDNEYYLRRMMNGKYNGSGTLFVDYRSQGDFSDWNTVIYGHNMNNDSMFGILPEYLDPEFYEDHPVMYLLAPEKKFRVEILGGYVTPSDSESYTIPATKEERDALIEKAVRSSSFVSGVETTEEDHLVTLSTCVYDYENARYVLVGVLREMEESV